MQKDSTRKDIIFILINLITLGFCIGVLPVFGQDQRSAPLDAFVMLENSTATKGTLEDQVNWLCETVIDGILIPGDRFAVWTYPDQPNPLIDLEISSEEQKEGVKNKIRSLVPTDRDADFSEAVRTIVGGAEKRSRPGLIAYVAILGSFVIDNGQSGTNTLPPDVAELLRYSRVEDHPGWKTIIIGLGLRERVRKAVESFNK